MRFTFIHAADLHIDSPLSGLGVKDPAVAERFAIAGRRAVEALVEETIRSEAAFLIIAGDLFDGEWKDVTTGLFFARAIGRLHRAGIRTALLKGNHDADSVVSRSLALPGSVSVFPSTKAESIAFDEHRVVLHGRSFTQRRVSDDFVDTYPARRDGWLNVGVLHTALDGTRGHESYAPCTIESLRRFGYDYWALGHVHAAETVCRDPWIVYPGNLQGRSVRETGAKGAVRVTVEDGKIVEVAPIVLDAARWAHDAIDVSACADERDVLDLIATALARLHALAEGRPLAVRLTLTGTTAAHVRLVATSETILAEARAAAFAVAEDLWVERVALRTQAPARRQEAPIEPDALDLDALLHAAAADPAFASDLSGLLKDITDKLPRELRDEIAHDRQALGRLADTARDHLLGALTA